MSGLLFSATIDLRLVGQVFGRRPAEAGQVVVVLGHVLPVGLDMDAEIGIGGLDCRARDL